MSNGKTAIKTDAAPGALGQIPCDPATGSVVSGGIGPQAGQVPKNLRAVRRTAGGDLDRFEIEAVAPA